MTDLNQLPGELNIAIKQGDDLSFDIAFNLDLTGYTLNANITPAGSAPALIPVVITNTDLSNGMIHLFVSRTSVASLPVNTQAHTFDLQWTLSGLKRTVLAGSFMIEER